MSLNSRTTVELASIARAGGGMRLKIASRPTTELTTIAKILNRIFACHRIPGTQKRCGIILGRTSLHCGANYKNKRQFPLHFDATYGRL